MAELKKKHIRQPLILAKTPTGEHGVPTQLFLVLDHECILVEGNFTKAIEQLYESIWAFDLQYPAAVKVCYSFLENIFEMNQGDVLSSKGKGKRSGQATQKFTHLMSLMKPKNDSNVNVVDD